MDHAAIVNGMDKIQDNPPGKLTIQSLRDFINQCNDNKSKAKWLGAECGECDEGLVFIKREIKGLHYSFVFRCLKCKSYDVKSYPYNTPEEIHNLDSKLEAIKTARQNGKFLALNNESRIN
jgi:hypothetical protein